MYIRYPNSFQFQGDHGKRTYDCRPRALATRLHTPGFRLEIKRRLLRLVLQQNPSPSPVLTARLTQTRGQVSGQHSEASRPRSHAPPISLRRERRRVDRTVVAWVVAISERPVDVAGHHIQRRDVGLRIKTRGPRLADQRRTQGPEEVQVSIHGATGTGPCRRATWQRQLAALALATGPPVAVSF